MLQESSRLPDAPTLLAAFQDLTASRAPSLGVTGILNREFSQYSSTSPAEVVTFGLDNGASIRLLCKYGTGSGKSGFGHRGGVPYEASIYRDVLTPLLPAHPLLRVPKYYGAHAVPEKGETWMFLEFLAGCERLTKTRSPSDSLVQAAKWIGTFHSDAEVFLTSPVGTSITQYDHHYLAGWAERTSYFATFWQADLPWLKPVCDAFLDRIPLFLGSHQTVIHGEFYPKNIVFHEGTVYPVDWESAAVGPGEIDLASLTDQWPAELIDACESAYYRARWPGRDADGFLERLTAARIYLRLRWLGDTSWGSDPELWRTAYAAEIDRLHADAIRFGLIG